MSDYTKGPWEILKKDNSNINWNSYHIGAYYNEVCIVRGTKNSMVDWLASCLDLEANANLIAAAPELYEALEAINDYWESGNFSRRKDLWDNMRSALAKARGE